MEYDLIPEFVLEALHKRGLTRVAIEASDPEELFKDYLEWYGFCGWSGSFITCLDELRKAKKA